MKVIWRLIFALLILSPLALHAQFIGFVSQQSIVSTPFNGVTCTVALASGSVKVSNIGQGAHWATMTTGNPVSFSYTIQGSYDGINFFDISDVGTFSVNSNGFTGVTASGYYPAIAIRVGTCTPSNALITIQYSGISLPPGQNYGTNQAGQLAKNIAVLAPANTTLVTNTFRSPFGNANGTLQFVYTGAAGPAGSTLTVGCGTNASFVPSVFTSVALQTTQSLVQTFQLPPSSCLFFSVSYTSGGASAANFNLDYLFANPGLPVPAQQFTHITGTTATVVKAVPGYLHAVTINTGGAGTVSIFDLIGSACTGTPATNTIAVITVTATTLQTFTYDVNTLNGICVKASAAMDFTVSTQ